MLDSLNHSTVHPFWCYAHTISFLFSPQGQAIGMCPKHKLFRGYIDLEIKLREFDRCRKLYEKWAEFDPENCKMWIQFATLEAMLNDAERARGIYELAICQPRLDMPEYMWKSYIDFEVSLLGQLLFQFLDLCVYWS